MPRIIVYKAVDEPHHPCFAYTAIIFHDDKSPALYRVTAETEGSARQAAKDCWEQDKARLAERPKRAAPITPRRRREEPDPAVVAEGAAVMAEKLAESPVGQARAAQEAMKPVVERAFTMPDFDEV